MRNRHRAAAATIQADRNNVTAIGSQCETAAPLVRLLRLVTVGPTTKKASSDNACYGCYGSVARGALQAFQPSMEQNTAIRLKLPKRYGDTAKIAETIPQPYCTIPQPYRQAPKPLPLRQPPPAPLAYRPCPKNAPERLLGPMSRPGSQALRGHAPDRSQASPDRHQPP